ncbi:hypothetical protein M3Y96_00149600 [Aphelenchoides besseyi]|nr:hypothetical protein M3Y96_00149600 [Aphelenchoides besseyi]
MTVSSTINPQLFSTSIPPKWSSTSVRNDTELIRKPTEKSTPQMPLASSISSSYSTNLTGSCYSSSNCPRRPKVSIISVTSCSIPPPNRLEFSTHHLQQQNQCCTISTFIFVVVLASLFVAISFFASNSIVFSAVVAGCCLFVILFNFVCLFC